jgi:serine/threonine protein phosphatase PrpC
MNRQEFYDLCKRHDWYYAMSDDHSVYVRGKKSRRNLEHISHQDPEFRDLLSAFARYYFTGEPFGTEQSPYPERPDD